MLHGSGEYLIIIEFKLTSLKDFDLILIQTQFETHVQIKVFQGIWKKYQNMPWKKLSVKSTTVTIVFLNK